MDSQHASSVAPSPVLPAAAAAMPPAAPVTTAPAVAAAGDGATPAKRKIIPTRVTAVDVQQSFLVSPSLMPPASALAGLLAGTPAAAVSAVGKTAGRGVTARSPFPPGRAAAAHGGELCCQLSFDGTPSKGRIAAAACSPLGGPSELLGEEVPAGLEQRLSGLLLGSPVARGALAADAAACSAATEPMLKRQQQQDQGAAATLLAADPSPMERYQRLSSQGPPGTVVSLAFDVPSQSTPATAVAASSASKQQQQATVAHGANTSAPPAAAASLPAGGRPNSGRLSPAKRPSASSLDEGQASPQPPAEAGPVLPSAQLQAPARRLAELHAGLLRDCSSINLAGELDLLLNLLAVPAAVRIDPALMQARAG